PSAAGASPGQAVNPCQSATPASRRRKCQANARSWMASLERRSSLTSGHLSTRLVLDLAAQFQQYTIGALQVLLHGAQADPDLLGNDLLRLTLDAVSAQDVGGPLGHLAQCRFDLRKQVAIDRDALGRGCTTFARVRPELRRGPCICSP